MVTGVGLALRVVGLALPGVLLVAATDPVRLADALTIHWRVSTRFAFGALAALRLVPLLIAEFESVRLARRTRGVEAGRNPVAQARLLAGIAFTLLVGAVRRGSRLATAMDARGLRLRHRPHQRPRLPAAPPGRRSCRRHRGRLRGRGDPQRATGAWSPIFVG